MNTRTVKVCAMLLTLLAFTSVSAESREKVHGSDDICRSLFETYIVSGKPSTSTLMAASHIVAERGRRTGFWKNVLQELRKGDIRTEIACVRVLGKMLAFDATDRDIVRRGEPSARPVSVILPQEIVEELLERGMNANRHRADHYCIALARARVPEAREFFNMVLLNNTGKNYAPDVQFHAAVGLANLGESSGIEWLIAGFDETYPYVANAWPPRVPDLKVRTCCNLALRYLSGERSLGTKKEWQAWWDSADRQAMPKYNVMLVDP